MDLKNKLQIEKIWDWLSEQEKIKEEVGELSENDSTAERVKEETVDKEDAEENFNWISTLRLELVEAEVFLQAAVWNFVEFFRVLNGFEGLKSIE